MKDKAAKYLALLVTDIFMYIFNTVFVYIGFNRFYFYAYKSTD